MDARKESADADGYDFEQRGLALAVLSDDQVETRTERELAGFNALEIVDGYGFDIHGSPPFHRHFHTQ